MQANIKEFAWTLGRGVVEGLLFFPILLMIGIYTIGQQSSVYLLGILFCLFVIAYVVRKMVDARRLLAFVLMGIVVLASLLLIGGIVGKVILLLLGVVVAFRGIQHAENEWEDIMPVNILWGVGVSVYFVTYLIFLYMERLSDYTNWVGYAGFVYIVITMLITNRRHLDSEASSGNEKKTVSSPIKRLNYAFLIGTIFIVFLLTNFSIVQSAIYHFFRSIIQSLARLMELLGGEESSQTPPPPADLTAMELPIEEDLEPSAFAAFLDMLAIIFGIIVAVILVLLALSIFIKKVRDFVKRVFQWIWNTVRTIFTRNTLVETESEYNDEKESVFDWKKWRNERGNAMKQRWQRLTRQKPKWDTMQPAEQVRYLIRSTIGDVKQRGKWRSSLTVRELLNIQEASSDELRDWYNRVRYGDGDLTSEEVNQLRVIREELYQREK
ncbi:hypothetical protein GGQ92_001081 [Gracilibacillus halotolerans]|uniref:DUF4129 domain-containing protein n=1 Tax=Gracilibacillus halotolerans TaxID=74386 RepID=A0A841RE70_9BACI|nr:hypothetical protein [Gracilibacillus halotolerans]MBB6512300.1 hypothetical protein [Gracilibacillus halotolerans]